MYATESFRSNIIFELHLFQQRPLTDVISLASKGLCLSLINEPASLFISEIIICHSKPFVPHEDTIAVTR
jgi:hypothetical protein